MPEQPKATHPGRHSSYQSSDLPTSPFILFYEVTRACDLACKHCRACAQTNPHPHELPTAQATALLDQIAEFPYRPLVVLSGGDPLKRPDVDQLIEYGTELGLSMSMSPACTPLASRERLAQLKARGMARIAVSLDGADAQTHDTYRGVQGSFNEACRMIQEARQVGLAVQVNTTIDRHNVDQVDDIANLLADMGIVLWSCFFLVPVGRGRQQKRIDPEQYESVFAQLHAHSLAQPYAIKTTEAPFYRRFLLSRGTNPHLGTHRAPLGINDGKGVIFISHTGDIYPSGFLPKQCGKFPSDSIIDVYQNHPVFQALRDPDQLQGKCGRCDYREVCGGSRARAYAVSGSYLAEEPDCSYQPGSHDGATPPLSFAKLQVN